MLVYKKRFLIGICLALIVASVISYFSDSVFIKRMDYVFFDYLLRLKISSRPQYPSPKIIIIDMDEDDFFKIRSSGKVAWRRSHFAKLAKALNAFDVKIIYFDILFSEQSLSEEDDDLFAQSIKEAGNVYLPYVLKGDRTNVGRNLFPIEPFLVNSKGMGFVNIESDIDGILRRIPLFYQRSGNVLHHHVVLEIIMDHLNLDTISITPKSCILSKDSDAVVKIPLVEKNKMLLNWLGDWGDAFIRYRFLDILQAYQDLEEQRTPKIDLAPLKDSICLVTITALGLYDLKPIPLNSTYPGVGIMATALSNILNSSFIKVVFGYFDFLFIFVLALIPVFLISEEKRFREITAMIIVFISIIIAYGLLLANYKIALSAPLLAFVVSYMVVASYNFARIVFEKKDLLNMATTDERTGLYNMRYFKMLVEAECHLTKGHQEKQFCIVICDIDHFKAVNDQYGHLAGDVVLQQVANRINSSVRSVDIVARYGGDEIMILLRGVRMQDGLKVANKVRANIEGMVIKNNRQVYRVTVSIGVTSFSKVTDSVLTLIKRADEALYKAKKEGRNRVCFLKN
ncbi:diguanylate cyclase [Candidatus Omnitrophota bacterium]